MTNRNAQRAANQARNALARSQLMWQAGDGGGARYAAQQADQAQAAAAASRQGDGADAGGRLSSEERQFPFVDPETGQRYTCESSRNLDRKIAADPNRLRRAIRRWIAGL